MLAASLAGWNAVVGGAMISGASASGSSGSTSGDSSGSGSGSSSTPASVTWSNPVNVAASGNSLTKTTGCDGCYDAGAVSQQQISGASGYAQFTADATGPLRVAGLAQGFSGTNPGTIRFGIRLQGNIAEVREGGIYRRDVTFAAGDVFRISVQSGVVSYPRTGPSSIRAARRRRHRWPSASPSPTSTARSAAPCWPTASSAGRTIARPGSSTTPWSE